MNGSRFAGGERSVAAGLVPIPSSASARFASIDTLRGLVMILMVLDHVRFFFLIHILALMVAMFTGQPHEWLSWRGSGQRPANYGYGLPVVDGLSVLVVMLLYPASRWFERFERTLNRKWLQYF